MKNEKFMSQMKGQDETPETQLNEVEIGDLPEKEWRQRMRRCKQCLPKT